MKKILLIVLALGFVSVSIAQVAQIKPKAWYKTAKAPFNRLKIAEQVPTYTGVVNPTVANNSRAADIVIGETWFDLASNSTVPNRIFSFDDGTMGTVWTRGMTSPDTYPDRGTAYNYFDGSTWGPYPTERIEEVRTGWASYAPYGTNGEIVCTHTGNINTGLLFSWRENKGEGTWNYFNLKGPAGVDILWPRMVTSGENHDIIQVIAATTDVYNGGAIYEGLDGALLYSRSTDGGASWDIENVVLDGLSSDYTNSWSADDYAWANSFGNTIALVAFSGYRDGVVMKSDDNGENWERIVFYASCQPFYESETIMPAFGGGDGNNAVAIDDEGIVHVAFGRKTHVNEDGAGLASYYYSDGLVYWNETMPALDTAMMQSYIMPEDWTTTNLYQNGNLAGWVQPHGEDTIVGVITNAYPSGLTSMPQLVVFRDDLGNKIVQVFYSSIAVGYANSDNTMNYRHIWGRFTEGDGVWSSFTDYTSDLFHTFSECVYPSVAPKAVNGKFHMIYQSDGKPGSSMYPTEPAHPANLNTIVYLAVTPLPVDVEENHVQALEIKQNFPNPFSGKTYVEISLNKATNVSMEVYTITGQKVAMSDYGYKSSGTHTITIDANQLTTGVYFYTVTAGGSKVTRKMMVE
ncbi:MAG: T9SS type A sorting domain-containing protein [Bacteroidales bacterium]|jgi:hypothetical protein